MDVEATLHVIDHVVELMQGPHQDLLLIQILLIWFHLVKQLSGAIWVSFLFFMWSSEAEIFKKKKTKNPQFGTRGLRPVVEASKCHVKMD
jgi:hypothetical protein